MTDETKKDGGNSGTGQQLPMVPGDGPPPPQMPQGQPQNNIDPDHAVYVISLRLLQSLVDYLTKQPYSEVFQFIG